MSEVVIVALISLTGTVLGSMIGARSGILKANELSNYRIAQLEKKVDKHNSVIERTFELEKRVALHDEQYKVTKHRLDDLEKGAG